MTLSEVYINNIILSNTEAKIGDMFTNRNKWIKVYIWQIVSERQWHTSGTTDF